MGMWEEDDAVTRWVHAICALPVIGFLVLDYSLISQTGNSWSPQYDAEMAAFTGGLYLACRLLWYAITGKNCINRDDY